MRKALALFAVAITLAGCQQLGRYPGQTDAQCIRAQMAPPANWMFDMAASRCHRWADDGTTATALPVNLAGNPDLIVLAQQYGVAYTP